MGAFAPDMDGISAVTDVIAAVTQRVRQLVGPNSRASDAVLQESDAVREEREAVPQETEAVRQRMVSIRPTTGRVRHTIDRTHLTNSANSAARDPCADTKNMKRKPTAADRPLKWTARRPRGETPPAMARTSAPHPSPQPLTPPSRRVSGSSLASCGRLPRRHEGHEGLRSPSTLSHAESEEFEGWGCPSHPKSSNFSHAACSECRADQESFVAFVPPW
jgi:hypothetical protein